MILQSPSDYQWKFKQNWLPFQALLALKFMKAFVQTHLFFNLPFFPTDLYIMKCCLEWENAQIQSWMITNQEEEVYLKRFRIQNNKRTFLIFQIGACFFHHLRKPFWIAFRNVVPTRRIKSLFSLKLSKIVLWKSKENNLSNPYSGCQKQ